MASVWTVDGIAADWSRVEAPDGKVANLPTGWLPADVREGDVVQVSLSSGSGSRTVTFKVDVEATAKRREQIKGLRSSIPPAPGGDVDL